MARYYLIAIFSVILSSFSQILLKKAAMQSRSNSQERQKFAFLSEYIHPLVLLGYGITAFCMLMTVFAFRGIPYKAGPALEALCYVYIMVLSRIFLGETITKKRLIGNLIICIGVLIFNI